MITVLPRYRIRGNNYTSDARWGIDKQGVLFCNRKCHEGDYDLIIARFGADRFLIFDCSFLTLEDDECKL